MSDDNQPAIPTERKEPSNFIESYYNQPEIGENQSNNDAIIEADKAVAHLYECNLCKKKYVRLQDLTNHVTNTHNYFNFLCWVCKRNLQMSHANAIIHFKEHENDILRRTLFTKKVENILFSLYSKKFDGRWPLSVFENEHLENIADVIRVNTFLKKRVIIQISLKLWFIPKPASEQRIGKYVWSTLPSIQFEWSSLNIKRKISEVGRVFMSSFLEQDSIEGSSSGFVYYATSEISLKCIKNVKIGCFLPNEHKYFQILDYLGSSTKQRVLYNPHCSTYCLKECLEKFCSISDININSNFDIFNKPTVSLLDFDELDHNAINFGLRIVVFEEETLSSVYPIFITDLFHNQSVQINLLAIANSATNDSAHFILILNLNLMLRLLNSFRSKIEKDNVYARHYCKYCLQKASKTQKLLYEHEKFCSSNPESNREDVELTNVIKFETGKSYLKCSSEGKSPPNWIGFADFETFATNCDNLYKKVCESHCLQENCKCSMTIKSNELEAMSYSLIFIDYNSHELISEVFYIRKKETEMKAATHFVSMLKQFAMAFQLINEINNPIKMTEQQKEQHRNATHCSICNQKFSERHISMGIFKNLPESNLEAVKTKQYTDFKGGEWEGRRSKNKTAHHIHHLKGLNFGASICSKCNLKIQSRYQKIPIFFHNFARFDHTLILKELVCKWSFPLKFIPKSLNNIMCIEASPFQMKDSLNFLSGSLDANVELARKSCLKSCEKCKSNTQCKRCELHSENLLRRTFPSIYSSDVSKVKGQIDMKRFLSNLKKSAFPYSILTSYKDILNMKVFPERKMFYSILKAEHVNENEYQLSKSYFQNYCTNMYDFLKIYNLLDVHLLYSVWRIMSETLYSNFGFYLEKFVSLPGYSLEVAKSFTPHPYLPEQTCIELFSEKNKDMYFKSLKNIRGGIVQCNSRFELDERFSNLISEYTRSSQSNVISTDLLPSHSVSTDLLPPQNEELLYIDATNLYGYCLSSLLPCGDYLPVSSSFIKSLNDLMRSSKTEKIYRILEQVLPDDSPQGYAFDIKIIHIPKKLHEFPPFYSSQCIKSTDISEKDKDIFKKINNTPFTGNKNKKLIPLLERGATTFCHYRLLKEAIKQGASIELLSGISFTQKLLFKDYIAILAKLRANSKNPAHAHSLKLLSNALFGKLLQSIVKYNRNFEFFYIPNWMDQLQITKDLTKINDRIQNRHRHKNKKIFKDIKIFDEDFFAIETQNSSIPAKNCPLIGFSILELAKTRNFTFFWSMKDLSPQTKMLYCDTDSFLLRINKAWYKEVSPIRNEFDFSKAALKFTYMMKLSAQEKENNRGVLGKYKSEIDKDSILLGYLALQKKCYCLLILKQYKCPHCQSYTALCKCIVNFQGKQLYYMTDNPVAKGKEVKQLSFYIYLKSLLYTEWTTQRRHKIEQEKKSLYFALKQYRGITNFDDSNFTLNCGLHNVPFHASNHVAAECDDRNCKKKSANSTLTKAAFIEKNFDFFRKSLYYFENGKIKIWQKI